MWLLWITLCAQNSSLVVSLGQKWWLIVLKTEIAWSKWEGATHIQRPPTTFLVVGGGGERFFFFGVPTCSDHIPKKVPMSSNLVLQIFNVLPKDITNNPWFETHVFWPKSSPSHLYRWTKILTQFSVFLGCAYQNYSLSNKKLGLWRQPKLMNMNHICLESYVVCCVKSTLKNIYKEYYWKFFPSI